MRVHAKNVARLALHRVVASGSTTTQTAIAARAFLGLTYPATRPSLVAGCHSFKPRKVSCHSIKEEDFSHSDFVSFVLQTGPVVAKLLPAAIWAADFPDNQESRLSKLPDVATDRFRES
jgi:hypothetical protein